MGYCQPRWLSDYSYRALTERVDALAHAHLFEPDEHTIWKVMLVNPQGETRWARNSKRRYGPNGVPVAAQVLGSDGREIATTTVFLGELSHGGGSIVEVPQPQRGWHSLRLDAAKALGYGVAISVRAMVPLR